MGHKNSAVAYAECPLISILGYSAIPNHRQKNCVSDAVHGAPVGSHKQIDTDGKQKPKNNVAIDITTTIQNRDAMSHYHIVKFVNNERLLF